MKNMSSKEEAKILVLYVTIPNVTIPNIRKNPERFVITTL
jgi:hypothetical protein